MQSLKSAKWINKLYIETSCPLSTARAKAAEYCKTEWVAEFDDDIELPDDWLPKLVDGLDITPDVLAISSPYIDMNPHIAAYAKAASLFRDPLAASTPYVCNTLIRRSVLKQYHPPEFFFCEDDLLYKFVTNDLRGKWLHQKNIGVRHYLIWRSYVGVGKAMREIKIYTKKKLAFQILSRFFVSIIAAFYSGTPKTTCLFWRRNFEIIWGYFNP